jgi:RecA-family ATPase
MIVIDTLQRCLGGNDENGTGMINFVRNAQELSRAFDCFVLVLHHVGWSNDSRIREHSSLRQL